MIVHFAYILQALPLIHIVHFALIFERANTAHSASTTSPAFAQKVPFLKIPPLISLSYTLPHSTD
jgi:hypothetical protein